MNAVEAKPNRRFSTRVLRFCLSLLIVAGCGPAGPPVGQNSPPLANAGTEQTVNTGASVTLDGSGSIGGSLSFSWKQLSGTTVSLSGTSGPIVTFTAPDKGTTLVFELTVSNTKGDSTAKVGVSVRPVERSAQIEEMIQRSVTDDPAVMGNFPNGWVVDRPIAPPTPPDGSELGEFREQYEDHAVLFAPTIEDDLAPGAISAVHLPVAGPSALTGSVRWVGTINPLDISISLDGSTLAATETTYHLGTNRGGSRLSAQTTAGGSASLSVTNTSGVAVKVKIALTATGL